MGGVRCVCVYKEEIVLLNEEPKKGVCGRKKVLNRWFRRSVRGLRYVQQRISEFFPCKTHTIFNKNHFNRAYV